MRGLEDGTVKGRARRAGARALVAVWHSLSNAGTVMLYGSEGDAARTLRKRRCR